MRDLAREAQCLRGDGVEMDRVVVAGDRGVLTAQVGRELPDDAVGRRGRDLEAGRGVGVALAAPQVGAGALPDRGAVGVGDGRGEVEDLALGVGTRRGHARRDLQGVADADLPVAGDGVLQVHRADGRGRERRVGHDRHVQAEGQHVRVGQRHGVLVREAADLGVRADVLAVDRDRRPVVGQAAEAVGRRLAHAGERADHRDARQRRAQQRAETGGAVVGGALRGVGHLRHPASSGRRPAPRCR